MSSIRDSVLEDKNVPVTVPAKYLEYTNVSFPDSSAKLPKRTDINNDSINLVDNKSPSYDLLSHPPALRYCSSARKTLLLNYASEISKKKKPDHEKPVPVALDWGATLLVKVLSPLGEGLLSRVGRVYPGGAGLYPSQYETFRFSSDFYWRFIQGFRWIVAPLTLMLKTIGLSDLVPRGLGTDEIVKGDGRVDKTVIDLSKSKSRKIIKKSKKPQRHKKVAKVIGLEKRLSKHQSSVDLIQGKRAPVRTLTVFQAFFARPRSCLDIIFESITNKIKQVELLMLDCVFS